MLRLENKALELVELFLDDLGALPGVNAELQPDPPFGTEPPQGCDAHITLWVTGEPITLLVHTKKTLYPRDVRQVLWRFQERGRNPPGESESHKVVPVVVAEAISPGAKALLREERVGYYDGGGSLFVAAGGVYLYVGMPPPKSYLKAVRFLFSGRRSQVLHTLLMQHQDWFQVTGLAGIAGVSPATVSKVMMELARFDWLEQRGRGPRKERHLRNPAALLDEWVKQLAMIPPPTMRHYYVPSTGVDALMHEMDQAFTTGGIEYAITHEAAGQRHAPYLSHISQVRCRMPTGPATDRAIRELGAHTVNEGFNLATIEAKSPGDLLFRERVNGVWLASPIQVYLDLVQSEGRAREMAGHLRRERLGF